MSGVTEHRMPNGSACWYRDEKHEYWQRYDPKTGRCSGRIAGASTISKNDGDTRTDGLVGWGARLTCEGIAREFDGAPASREWLRSSWEIQERLRAKKLTWRDIRDEGGLRGTVSHAVLEALAAGEEPEITNGYDKGVLCWWREARPTTLLSEQVVYSEERNFAGRFDLLADIDAELTLVDLKTSGFLANSFAVQLNLYRLAMLDAGFPVPELLLIVQVDEEGGFTEVPVPVRPGWALQALHTYTMGSEIRRELKAAA